MKDFFLEKLRFNLVGFSIQMNLIAAHCQRSKDLWLRMLAECQQRKANDLITTCYNNSKNFNE
jgi:hypothetical protein